MTPADESSFDRRPELARIVEVYDRRYPNDLERYSLFEAGEHFLEATFERDLIAELAADGVGSLGGLRILEIGCGDGRRLRCLQRLGALPRDEYGIDLFPRAVADARLRSGNCSIVLGSASELPWPDGCFDVVFQRTVMTSILDPRVRREVAREMLRVLRRDGRILWYDFHVDNPRNPNVRGVGWSELRELFPGCDLRLRRSTLAPPLARALAPWSWSLALLLEKVPFLRTHTLGLLRKRAEKER